jgi:hypothetical protein
MHEAHGCRISSGTASNNWQNVAAPLRLCGRTQERTIQSPNSSSQTASSSGFSCLQWIVLVALRHSRCACYGNSVWGLLDCSTVKYACCQAENIGSLFLTTSVPQSELSDVLMMTMMVEVATDLGIRVRFSALPDFLICSGSGTGSAQPREYNWGATWKKK